MTKSDDKAVSDERLARISADTDKWADRSPYWRDTAAALRELQQGRARIGELERKEHDLDNANRTIESLVVKIKGLEAALAGVRADAERYRCVRDRRKDFAITQNIGHDWIVLELQEADAAIDAALAASGET